MNYKGILKGVLNYFNLNKGAEPEQILSQEQIKIKISELEIQLQKYDDRRKIFGILTPVINHIDLNHASLRGEYQRYNKLLQA